MATRTLKPGPTLLDEPEVAIAAEAATRLAALAGDLHEATVVRVGSRGHDTQVTVPAAALHLFVEILAELANGNAVTVAPTHAELTTQQAADLMNVSRPYLIKLLDEGEIPFRRVGNRRKVKLRDLLGYMERDDAYRKSIADELTREAQRQKLDYVS